MRANFGLFVDKFLAAGASLPVSLAEVCDQDAKWSEQYADEKTTRVHSLPATDHGCDDSTNQPKRKK